MKSSEIDSWDEMPTIVQESVEKGLGEAEKGIGRSHSDVIRDAKEWVKK